MCSRVTSRCFLKCWFQLFLKILIPSSWFRCCKFNKHLQWLWSNGFRVHFMRNTLLFPTKTLAFIVLSARRSSWRPWNSGLTHFELGWVPGWTGSDVGMGGLCCGTVCSGRWEQRRGEQWGLKANVCCQGFQPTCAVRHTSLEGRQIPSCPVPKESKLWNWKCWSMKR